MWKTSRSRKLVADRWLRSRWHDDGESESAWLLLPVLMIFDSQNLHTCNMLFQ